MAKHQYPRDYHHNDNADDEHSSDHYTGLTETEMENYKYPPFALLDEAVNKKKEDKPMTFLSEISNITLHLNLISQRLREDFNLEIVLFASVPSGNPANTTYMSIWYFDYNNFKDQQKANWYETGPIFQFFNEIKKDSLYKYFAEHRYEYIGKENFDHQTLNTPAGTPEQREYFSPQAYDGIWSRGTINSPGDHHIIEVFELEESDLSKDNVLVKYFGRYNTHNLCDRKIVLKSELEEQYTYIGKIKK